MTFLNCSIAFFLIHEDTNRCRTLQVPWKINIFYQILPSKQLDKEYMHACMQKELSDPLYIQRRFFYMKQWDTEDNNRYLTERHKNLHILHVECQVPQLVYDLRIYTVKMNCLIKKSLMCKIFQKKTF